MPTDVWKDKEWVLHICGRILVYLKGDWRDLIWESMGGSRNHHVKQNSQITVNHILILFHAALTPGYVQGVHKWLTVLDTKNCLVWGYCYRTTMWSILFLVPWLFFETSKWQWVMFLTEDLESVTLKSQPLPLPGQSVQKEQHIADTEIKLELVHFQQKLLKIGFWKKIYIIFYTFLKNYRSPLV